MKAIRVSCPNCGAGLKADASSTTVTCEYCMTSSTIQRRTGFFERMEAPPISVSGVPGRYARQRHSSRWLAIILVLGLVVPLVVMGVGIRAAMRQEEESQRHVRAAAERARTEIDNALAHVQRPPSAPRPEAPNWQGTNGVLVADVDGDGTPELIGRGRQSTANDSVRVIALDLVTGKQKWQTDFLGTYTDTYQGVLALAGDRILYVSNKAALSAFSLRDGKHLWSGTLDERIRTFCAGPTADTVIAIGYDDKGRSITLADGTIGPAKPGFKGRTWHDPPPCPVIPNDYLVPFEGMKTPGSLMTNKLHLGIDVDAVVDGPGGRVISGERSEGTRVTTIVALDANGKERWRTTGAAEALAAVGGARYVVVGERETCIVYNGSDYRLACFALADGKRLWDLETSTLTQGLFVIGRLLVVTTSQQLEVRDLDTGTVKWSLD